MKTTQKNKNNELSTSGDNLLIRFNHTASTTDLDPKSALPEPTRRHANHVDDSISDNRRCERKPTRAKTLKTRVGGQTKKENDKGFGRTTSRLHLPCRRRQDENGTNYFR